MKTTLELQPVLTALLALSRTNGRDSKIVIEMADDGSVHITPDVPTFDFPRA